MKLAVTGIVVNKQNKVLVGKKIIKDGHFLSGCWHIPGGHVKPEETDIQALKREFVEESKLQIEVVKQIAISHINKSEIHWYVCSALNQEPKAGDDLELVEFVEKNEVEKKCHEKAVSRWPTEVKEFLNS